jgi:Glycosyltransferases involved in cell wall biogenesis
VSLLIPAKAAASWLETTIASADAFLRGQFGESYEILLVITPGSSEDSSLALAERLAEKYPRVRALMHAGVVGKGAALRSGFDSARGEWIFFIDADLPYDLEFFTRAAAELHQGADFVTANRRMLISEFDVPVRLLPIAYRRHRLGLLFNRVARMLFPIETTDTQAGIKCMSGRMAEAAFDRQSCPGFLFDLEFFLTARRHGFRVTELPVTLYLNSEKSTVRLARDLVLSIFWLLRIRLQDRRGLYGEPA